MPDMAQYRITWTGGRVGSGISTFYLMLDDAFSNWGAVNAAFSKWLTTLKLYIPNEITLRLPGEVNIIDVTTGELQEVRAITQGATLTGSGNGTNWASVAGYVVRWSTNRVTAGRRLVGRTFIVPAAGDAFVEGSVAGNLITQQNTAHALLLTELEAAGAELLIYSKTHGTTGIVTGGTTLSKGTSLRTRND